MEFNTKSTTGNSIRRALKIQTIQTATNSTTGKAMGGAFKNQTI